MNGLVLITGCARSGTSMVSGVLSALGLDFGKPLHSKRRTYQPRGFFEHRHVRERVVKPMLKRLGADPLGQNPLPPRILRPSDREALALGLKVRRELGQRAQAYKDAKVLLMWPYFHKAFPDATWVLVRRDRKAIALSCQRTPFMQKRSFLAGWLEWVDEHEARMDDLRASGARVLEIWPDAGDVASFRPLVEELGLEWDEAKVEAALVPSAWHR